MELTRDQAIGVLAGMYLQIKQAELEARKNTH
jgi:hypothetical protein